MQKSENSSEDDPGGLYCVGQTTQRLGGTDLDFLGVANPGARRCGQGLFLPSRGRYNGPLPLVCGFTWIAVGMGYSQHLASLS